ncbi:MAG: STAS domain-containing protein [Candidatus Ozemobacteraceae bacterium]
MKFEITQQGNFTIIHLKERIDISNAPLLDSLLETKILAGQNAIILDLTEVTFVDSSGASVLARIYRLLKESEGMMILAGCSPYLKRLFSTIGFHNIFRITATLDEALLR